METPPLDASLEAMLIRALDIYNRIKGQQSSEVMSCLAQLRSIRSKLNKTTKSDNVHAADEDNNDDDDDHLDYKVSGENKASFTTEKSNLMKTDKIISEEDKRKLSVFEANDAHGRMMQANIFFNQGKFVCAEVLLKEAMELFAKTEGTVHFHGNSLSSLESTC